MNVLNQTIKIEGTISTPYIVLDYNEGEFLFEGRCMPENIHEFFETIMKWFEAFSENPRPGSVFKFKLDYFNTASSKIIIKILKIIKDIDDDSIYVEWHYKDYDEDVKEVGEDFVDIVGPGVIKLIKTAE